MQNKFKLILISGIILALLLGFLVYAKLYLSGWFINPTHSAKQMVLVIGDDWQATRGILYRFQRGSRNMAWQRVGNEIPVNLGRNGLGWGIGLHGSTLTLGPRTIEGAHITPVGVFKITQAFGKESSEKFKVKIPYQQITNTLFCPDDRNSKFYNMLVDTKNVTKDWQSAENMYDYMQQGVYAYGFIINHNYDKPIPGRGSCFFVHVYRGENIPTLGCTSFKKNLVREVLLWLDPMQNPVLVQLPKNMYSLFKNRWNLPKI